MWRVPHQPDKENLRKIVKAFLISAAKQRGVDSAMQSRIAAMETANLLALSRTADEQTLPRETRKPNVISGIFCFEDILASCGRLDAAQTYSNACLVFKASGHTTLVSSLSFNTSACFLASGCDGGILNIWSLEVGIGLLYHHQSKANPITPCAIGHRNQRIPCVIFVNVFVSISRQNA